MNPHDQRIIHSSVLPNWRTPNQLYAKLHNEFNFRMDLAADAASSKCGINYLGPGAFANPRGYSATFNQRDALSGKAGDWRVHGRGFLNPPWSKEAKLPLTPWIERMIAEAQEGWEGVAILPASIQTRWWQRVRAHAYEIRLIPHRVSFELGPEDLRKWQEAWLARQTDPTKQPPAKPANAGGNTAVVVWKPLRGYVGPWEASVRYWTYRDVIREADVEGEE